MRYGLVVGSILMVFTTAALAQPMMCGNGIINPGDSGEQVLALCGQPAAAKQWVQNIPAGDDDSVIAGLARAMREFDSAGYDPVAIRAHAETYSPAAFRTRMADIVAHILT